MHFDPNAQKKSEDAALDFAAMLTSMNAPAEQTASAQAEPETPAAEQKPSESASGAKPARSKAGRKHKISAPQAKSNSAASEKEPVTVYFDMEDIHKIRIYKAINRRTISDFINYASMAVMNDTYECTNPACRFRFAALFSEDCDEEPASCPVCKGGIRKVSYL